jgi:spore germination protein YaaH
MMKKIVCLLLFLAINEALHSQIPDSLRKSIHQVEDEYYRILPQYYYPKAEKEAAVPSQLIPNPGRISARVLGWHPYWVSSSAYLSYDYTYLSHIAYFSYEVDTATGGYTSIHEWNTTPIIDYAHQKGTKVLLTVTNFGTSRNATLLKDTIRQKNLINNLITLLRSRNGDGVNFDLESVGSSQRTNLTRFISLAVRMIRAELPAAEISMATPAVDWNNSWDLKVISEQCDFIILMGYDYYWSGSATAGPVAPLENETYNVTRSIETYLAAGVSTDKLLLGVPWYGYDWPVTNNYRKSSTTGTATARIYTSAKQIAKTNGSIFDQLTKVPWVKYTSSSSWRQLWYDDTLSLSLKYNLVSSKSLGGIGIWALSYEGGSAEIWRTLKRSITPPDSVKSLDLNVYPNPANGVSKITFYLAGSQHVTLRIFDMMGKERMILLNTTLETGKQEIELNTALLGPGIYLCVLQTGTGKSSKKIVIIKG